jgi:hypothetical protein
MPVRTTKASKEAPAACFLCGKPILPEEMEDAFRRLRDDAVPSSLEVAHFECAMREGLLDEEDDEDRLPRRGG